MSRKYVFNTGNGINVFFGNSNNSTNNKLGIGSLDDPSVGLEVKTTDAMLLPVNHTKL